MRLVVTDLVIMALFLAGTAHSLSSTVAASSPMHGVIYFAEDGLIRFAWNDTPKNSFKTQSLVTNGLKKVYKSLILMSEWVGVQAHNRSLPGSLAQVSKQGPSKAAYHQVDKEQL